MEGLSFHRKTNAIAEDDSVVLSCRKMSSQHGILRVFFIDLKSNFTQAWHCQATRYCR